MNATNHFPRFVLISYATATAILFASGYAIGQVNLILWFNRIHTPLLDRLFYSLTMLGTAVILIPFLIAAVFHRFSLAIGLISNVVLQSIVVSVFKRILFPRAPRPIQFLNPEIINAVQGVSIHKWMSFPSGHTVTIFAICAFVSLWSKNYWMSSLLLLLAILVGASRLYLTQHFPLDVAFGALFGTIIGTYTFKLSESWNKSNYWMNQRIHLPKLNIS